MAINDKIKIDDWKTKGFDEFLARRKQDTPTKPGFIGGLDFDGLLDEMLFNRMIRLKNLRQKPQGNEPGKMYWDATNKRVKLWVDGTTKWVDIPWATSTTTTSTSTTSSSTSTTVT